MDIRIKLAKYVKCQICKLQRLDLLGHITKVHERSKEYYLREFPGASVMSEQRSAGLIHAKKLWKPHWEPLWTPEYLLDRLYEMHANGVLLNANSIKKVEPQIRLQAIQYFKSWDTALKAIGMNLDEVRKVKAPKNWTKNSVRDSHL